MTWASRAAPGIGDLIVFDGDCVLCSHAAQFVHRRDPDQRFKFVAIQSAYGRDLAARFGIDADVPQTNAVVIDQRAHFKSDAAIEILAALPGWRCVGAFRALPSGLRNWFYDRIARNRYRWFGRRPQCWAGDARLQARILDHAP